MRNSIRIREYRHVWLHNQHKICLVFAKKEKKLNLENEDMHITFGYIMRQAQQQQQQFEKNFKQKKKRNEKKRKIIKQSSNARY